MQLDDFDYYLPEELVAQHPTERRDGARMLCVRRSDGSIEDRMFSSFPSVLRTGDVLVLNNTRVFPARLLGRSETGAGVELFLIERLFDDEWEALARPARRLKAGKQVVFAEDLSGVIVEQSEGRVRVRFQYDGDFDAILERVGRTPLPPYIKRKSEQGIDDDRDRYQTVYAKEPGAIAAPTAGLHFTSAVMDTVRARGIEVVELTLHVGYGTFEPVRVEDLSRHSVLAERYEIDEHTAHSLNGALKDRRRIIAVGTTTTRALESAISNSDTFSPGKAVADLTITPGFDFKAVGAMLTNFHLPKSSLLILVSTFGGHELIMGAYRHAVGSGYRFYSYGDCMFVE